MNHYPEYVDERLRLSWKLICGAACQAMIMGLTLDEYVERAIARYQPPPPPQIPATLMPKTKKSKKRG